MMEIDRVIHEPARLLLMIYLYSVKEADFKFLKIQTGLTQGNLSSHLRKLEHAGYIHSEKKFRDRRPVTLLRISERGRQVFEEYIQNMHLFFSDLKRMIR